MKIIQILLAQMALQWGWSLRIGGGRKSRGGISRAAVTSFGGCRPLFSGVCASCEPLCEESFD
jgi:hypothetical protein